MSTNQGCKTVVPLPNQVVTGYLYRSLDSAKDELQALGSGSTFSEISTSNLASLSVSLPPLDEQRAIADFLDAMDARITRFIAARKKMIRLLEEKKQAVINQAVTKGLDPTVPMKHSGVDWLGEIPAHWEVRRLRSLAEFVTSGSRDWGSYYSDEGPKFIRIGNLSTSSVDMKLDSVQRVSLPDGVEGTRTSVKEGDVLLSITAQMGAVGLISTGFGKGYINQHTALIRLTPDPAMPRWVAFNLLSVLGRRQTEMLTNGGTKLGLTLDDVKSIKILVPPPTEQHRTVEVIDNSLATTDTAISRAQREIELVQEYRTRLISNVVTGKLDVRGVDLGELPEFEEIPGEGELTDLDHDNDGIAEELVGVKD